MAVGTEVGLGPGHIVLDGDPAPLPIKGVTAPQFSAHVYCGQTAGWIKMPLGTKVGLGPCHTAPLFSAHVYCGRGRSSQLLLSSCLEICKIRF